MKALGVLAPCALALLALGTLADCGPSFQAVYECDVHFEHCYAVDMSELPLAEKRLCWREWIAGYTYGESRDRVEHARRRLAALSSDDPSPPLGDAASGVVVDPLGPAPAPVHAPLPASVFSPPPRVSDVHAVDAGEAGALEARETGDAALARPGAQCTDGCERSFESCRGGCAGVTCAPCDRAYRACMPSCFRDGFADAKP
jgi:hypothetical protein